MTGLGVATVSRALNDAPDIGQATKERVRLVAKQIGYRPDRAGVRLRTGKTHVVSLILNLEEEVAGLMPNIMMGISEVLDGTPYHLVVTPYHIDTDPLDPVQYVVETGLADGIILSRTEPEDARVSYLAERNFPFAAHGRTDMGIVHPFHDFDNEAYAGLAVDWLAERGRKRLALFTPPSTLSYAQHMTTGFIKAVDAHGLVEVPVRKVTIDSTGGEIVAEFERLMRSRNRPDGIIAAGPNATIAAAAGIEAAGCTIGEEVDMVTKQTFDLIKKFRPAIHVIHEDHRAAGRGLAEAVLRTIEGESAANLQTLVKPE